MMLTVKEFTEVFPNCKDPSEWIVVMNDLFPKYNITTPQRQAAFLAQCGHESGGWRVFIENLNYSANGLNSVFPKYFKNAGLDAEKYARKPEEIANIVYANRMGNGDVKSGDGWKFRGRGPIQLTGRDNYRRFGRDIMEDLEANPDLVFEDKKISLLAALWFWDKHSLNKFADVEDIKGMTRVINGGFNGLDDRLLKYKKIIQLLNDPSK